MRSKPASKTSPATGAGDGPGASTADPDALAERAASPKDPERRNRSGLSPLEVELEVSRQRSTGWAIFGVVLGALLIWKLGTVGVWAGIVLVATGVYHAWNLWRTYRYPPGTIVVSDSQVSLPRGVCMPDPVVVAPQEITAVYFLRRSVPWNHAAPVLIIELGSKAMAFPRDWFASEAEQRHVLHALLRDKLTVAAGDESA